VGPQSILPMILGIQTKPTECRKRDIIDDKAVRQLAQGIIDQDGETARTCKYNILHMNPLPWKKNDDGTAATWPPSKDVLDEFGYGKVDNKTWWQEKTGLNPPSMWNVAGALDLLPKVPIPSHQKTRASEALDGAIHGVANVWSEETLAQI